MVIQPSMPKAKPQFRMPPLACDCHTHVFGPYDRFPLSLSRTYNPPEAPLDLLTGFLEKLGLERVVVVQPSVYGIDNTATLDAVRRSEGRARAVAVIADDADRGHLADMHKAGVRGVRLNLMMAEEPSLDAASGIIRGCAERIKLFGWHIQLFAPLRLIVRLSPFLSSLPVRVVVDHFGWPQPAFNVDDIHALCALVAGGNTYVKLSAAYRLSTDGFNDPAAASLARDLISANSRALVWGSDWPHPGAFVSTQGSGAPSPLHDIDDVLALDKLAEWAGSDEVLRAILVDNPARLYDFS
jgi:predicted TIM-barrel fold metal-dependent hydrolase